MAPLFLVNLFLVGLCFVRQKAALWWVEEVASGERQLEDLRHARPQEVRGGIFRAWRCPVKRGLVAGGWGVEGEDMGWLYNVTWKFIKGTEPQASSQLIWVSVGGAWSQYFFLAFMMKNCKQVLKTGTINIYLLFSFNNHCHVIFRCVYACMGTYVRVYTHE